MVAAVAVSPRTRANVAEVVGVAAMEEVATADAITAAIVTVAVIVVAVVVVNARQGEARSTKTSPKANLLAYLPVLQGSTEREDRGDRMEPTHEAIYGREAMAASRLPTRR